MYVSACMHVQRRPQDMHVCECMHSCVEEHLHVCECMRACAEEATWMESAACLSPRSSAQMVSRCA